MEQGAEVVIIDPVYELALSGGSSRLKGEVILPLFHLYLQAYVFRHSLVGKV
ncbi:MAG: hypothetical protein LBG52_06305 [Candidatus Peribacteria bacterium]|nr:hypothetical protein [Candidatus Peribacteria bacterium]